MLERVASASFPAELRAMVMTALVRRKLPRLNFRAEHRHVTAAPVAACLDTESYENLDGGSRTYIEQAFHDAVFKTTIFTIDLLFHRKDVVLGLNSPSFLQGKESAVRYLNSVVTFWAMSAYPRCQVNFSRAIEGIGLVKLPFSNLVHCVLTIRIIRPAHARELFPAEILSYP